MKLKKKSGLIGVVVALSAASLVSVGFASWVISQGDTKTANGNIVVDDVSDDRHIITATWVTDSTGATPLGSNPNVIYGHPATMNAANEWLSNADASMVEALTFYLKVAVSNVDTSDTVSSVISNIAVTSSGGGTVDTDYTGYDGAVGKNYVAALPTPSAGATNFDANGAVVYTITFGWGSAFGGVNPYNYYNDGTKTAATHGDEAALKLGQLETLLTGASFVVTVTSI